MEFKVKFDKPIINFVVPIPPEGDYLLDMEHLRSIHSALKECFPEYDVVAMPTTLSSDTAPICNVPIDDNLFPNLEALFARQKETIEAAEKFYALEAGGVSDWVWYDDSLHAYFSEEEE